MVNLSSRFMAATKQMKTFVQISQFVFNYLTPKMKPFLRLIDKVTVKGSSIPMKIYCFDLNVAAIEGGADAIDLRESNYSHQENESKKLIFQNSFKIQKDSDPQKIFKLGYMTLLVK